MTEKSVTDMILDKFTQSVAGDSTFKGICEELLALMKSEKPEKERIKAILEKIVDENPKP